MEPVGLTRMRWRMRGAWMWPAFVVLTVIDGLILHFRPIAGDATGVVPALLLAGFFNLVAVAVLAPLIGWLVRRRRRDLPRMIAADYAGSALLGVLTAVLLTLGLIHHRSVLRELQAREAATLAVHRYVLTLPDPSYRQHLAQEDMIRLQSGLYRSCVPGAAASGLLCLYVTTDQSPAGVRVDPSREPNSQIRAAGGF